MMQRQHDSEGEEEADDIQEVPEHTSGTQAYSAFCQVKLAILRLSRISFYICLRMA